MKFTSVIFSSVVGLAAFAAAQTETTSSEIGVTSAVACIRACAAADVTCQAQCQGNPTPDAGSVEATQACAAACDQGDGSAEATKKYGDCQQACFASNYFTASGTSATFAAASTSSAVVAAASTTAASATASVHSGMTTSTRVAGTTSAGSATTSTGKTTSTSTGAVAATSSAKNAGERVVLSLPVAGFAGLLAFLAL